MTEKEPLPFVHVGRPSSLTRFSEQSERTLNSSVARPEPLVMRSSHRGECKLKSLLVYQGQQRRRWHLTIGMGRGWSLAQINQDILVKTRDNLFTQARNSELAKLTKVCILLYGSSSTLTVFSLSLLFSPPLPDLLSLSPIAPWDHDDWDNTTRRSPLAGTRHMVTSLT